MATQIIPLPFPVLNPESSERKGRNYKKLEYLENEKIFLDEIKSVFHSF